MEGPRPTVKPFLGMPETAQGSIPELLSQTGAYADLRSLRPAAGIIPYELALPFWSDGAVKLRLAAIPGQVKFSEQGEWQFPPGSVFIKTFEMPVDASRPQVTRRLETRLLVVDRTGGVYGVSYKWRADLSDADLVAPSGIDEALAVSDANNRTQQQVWSYPGREDCLVCHNGHTRGVLGPKTRQLNIVMRYPDGRVENQLRRWNRWGVFSEPIDETTFTELPVLARPDARDRTLEDRARSWLDANCAHCHRPGGTVANFDARYETPLTSQQLIDGPVLIDQNIDRARVISPHDPWRSVALMRISTNEDIRMPPLARHVVDAKGVALIRDWIMSLPGKDVLPPPQFQPAGGSFAGPVTVTLASSEPGAEIRYTLDGSAPGPNDSRYEAPIHVEGPAVVRARAYKDGFTRSVIAQQTYVIGN